MLGGEPGWAPRVQAELAQHTQRAASTIDVQHRELDLLKGRIRWVPTSLSGVCRGGPN